jgi:hypothetical protein
MAAEGEIVNGGSFTSEIIDTDLVERQYQRLGSVCQPGGDGVNSERNGDLNEQV